jgi:hypothetical protein
VAAAPLLALLVAAAAPLDAPLGVGTPGTLRQLFLDVTAADARAPGPLALDLRWALANEWSTPTALVRGERVVQLRTDEQLDALQLAASVPWARLGASPLLARGSTTVAARLYAHWGGYTDGLVEWWHRFGHYTNFQRQLFGRDAIHVLLREPGGRTLVALDRGRLAPGDVALQNQVLLAAGGASLRGAASRWGVSARVDLKLPVGSLASLGGSGSPDAALALLGTAELTSWLTLHALAAGSAWGGLPDGFALQPRRWHATGELSLAAVAWGTAFIVEDRLVSPAFEDGWKPAADAPYEVPSSATFATLRWHNQISGGIRRGPVTFWFSEDFTPGARTGSGGPSWFYDSNAPDIVFGLALRLPP